MTTEQRLCQAIRDRHQIAYAYFLPGRGTAVGKRIGNPHIVYHEKNGLAVHIWKIWGVSTDPHEPLPGWRLYYLSGLQEIHIESKKFSIEETFNPNWARYQGIVCQV